MFKRDRLELSVVRTEGLNADLSSLGCYISIDGRLFDVITPLNSNNEEIVSELPTHGTLRLIVKSMTEQDEVLGSVSVPLSTLPSEGFQWLPLFENLEEDEISKLPEDVDLPRILLLFYSRRELSPVPEITEITEYSVEESVSLGPESVISTDRMPELKLMDNYPCVEIPVPILEVPVPERLASTPLLETSIEHIDVSVSPNTVCRHLTPKTPMQFESFHDGTREDQLLANLEKCRMQLKRQLVLQEDLTKQIMSSQEMLQNERLLRKSLASKLEDIRKEYEESITRGQKREEQFVMQLGDKDKIIQTLENSMRELQQNLNNLEIENKNLNERINLLQTQVSSNSYEAVFKQLELYETQLEASEKERNTLQNALNTLQKEWDDLIESKYNPIIAHLENDKLLIENQLKEAEVSLGNLRQACGDINRDIQAEINSYIQETEAKDTQLKAVLDKNVLLNKMLQQEKDEKEELMAEVMKLQKLLEKESEEKEIVEESYKSRLDVYESQLKEEREKVDVLVEELQETRDEMQYYKQDVETLKDTIKKLHKTFQDVTANASVISSKKTPTKTPLRERNLTVKKFLKTHENKKVPFK
jgi:hypothetical protein